MSDAGAVTVVLAAGAGRRLGGVAKALLRDASGASFLSIVAACAAQAGAPVAVVVVGEPHRAETEREAKRLGLEIAVNTDPERGMASSVAVGFARASSWRARTALLWPVDHASVERVTVEAVIRASDARRIVVPTFANRGGHPTAFGRATWADLAACDAAVDGARSVLRAHEGQVMRMPVTDAGVIADVDTPADRGPL